jgi:hypothetical protein
MATTTNFGWETPDDTDLVKDGAAAMRTLGNSIDTSFVDLKGGTSGQILAKASNTDLDYTWITNDIGDITAVTAGTGLTGGGTSGAVSLAIDSTVATLTGTQTLTNKTLTSPALTTPTISTIDAKGDLLAGTADNTIGRLAVGANNTVLTADSSTATGLKWATPAAGGGKVLQVVQGTTTTQTANSTSTYTDTTLTATITPTSASSKVLVMVAQNGLLRTDGSAENAVDLILLRGATTISTFMTRGYRTATALLMTGYNGSVNYLDSPATTSATTYKTQFRNVNNTAEVRVQQANDMSTIILLEIGA